ncbi:MAG: hypothetical protein H7Y36_06010, partial [Armatimonadetes bacterium]|nr:hypothetical protein [Akkermansiaceae bacterium]
MKPFAKFPLRIVIYFAVLAYLTGDLFLLKGPLYRRIQSSRPDSPESIAKAKANGVVARVLNHHITRSQLDYAINERLWIEGKKLASLSPEEKKRITHGALDELIDHHLLRIKVQSSAKPIPVSYQEIDARLNRFIGKFETKGHLETAMKSQGIPNAKSLRQRIAGRIQQEKYIAMR